ncbi:MAG TPA: hypothetical protein VEH04_08960 [Verrucomicrobiae bacterium]|nr:hypothetical protein [Verrucomicrobiae bacterium]
MKLKAIATAVLLACFILNVSGQTADDHVAWGRAHLADGQLPAANASFAAAVSIEPGHPVANTLFGITRLLVLPNRNSVKTLLDRSGVEAEGRDVLNWTAEILRSRDGLPLIASGMNSVEFVAVLQGVVLSEIRAAQANMANVVDPNFLLALTAAETRTVKVTLDYGDIQLIQAGLHGLEYVIRSMSPWNLEANLSTLKAWHASGGLNVERVLRENPQLLTFATTNDWVHARVALLGAIERYQAASSFIRNRSPLAVRLFNLADRAVQDEARVSPGAE